MRTTQTWQIRTGLKSTPWKTSPVRRGLNYREMRGSVLLTIGESVTANLDHVCLNNQSHYNLDVIEFQSELCDTQEVPYAESHSGLAKFQNPW